MVDKKKDETPAVEKPKRLSAVERLAAQLEEAKAKAKAKDAGKLEAATTKRDAAKVAVTKAQAKLDEAQAVVDSLSVVGGNDPIVEATTAAELEAENTGDGIDGNTPV